MFWFIHVFPSLIENPTKKRKEQFLLLLFGYRENPETVVIMAYAHDLRHAPKIDRFTLIWKRAGGYTLSRK